MRKGEFLCGEIIIIYRNIAQKRIFNNLDRFVVQSSNCIGVIRLLREFRLDILCCAVKQTT